jgi:hypothetical protein
MSGLTAKSNELSGPGGAPMSVEVIEDAAAIPAASFSRRVS